MDKEDSICNKKINFITINLANYVLILFIIHYDFSLESKILFFTIYNVKLFYYIIKLEVFIKIIT